MTFSSTHFSKPARLSEQIFKVISGLGHGSTFLGWRVVDQWSAIVGDEIASQSQAQRFAEGTIYVRVENPVLRQNLSMKQEMFLEKIKEFTGRTVVQRIYFR